jgi:hypothetical protein
VQIKYAHTYLDRETMYLINRRKKKKRRRRRKGKGPHTNATCASRRTEVHVSQQPKVQVHENSHRFFSLYIKKKINKQRGAKAAGTKKKKVGHPCPLPVFPYL